MRKEIPEEGKAFWIPPDLLAVIREEARRLTTDRRVEITESQAQLYWLRRGMKAEPQIKGLLT